MTIEMFARMMDIPIFKAGTHPTMYGPKTFTPEEIDEMLENTQAALPELMEYANAGAYDGANAVYNYMPLPQIINLGHGKYLPEVMKSLAKQITATFSKSGEWIQANLENVPGEVAQFIRDRFPYRSVEILPVFKSKTGQVYRNVIRSIAFLSPDQPPAVSGQIPQVAIAFSQTPKPSESVWVFQCGDAQTPSNQPQELHMDETKQGTGGEQAQTAPASAPDNRILEFQAQLDALKVENTQTKAANAKLAQALAEEQAARLAQQKDQEHRDIELFCQGLLTQDVIGEQGKRFKVAPALVSDDVKQALLALNHHAVLEFSSGSKATSRAFVQQFMTNVIEMAAQGKLLIPMGQEAPAASHITPAKVLNFADIQKQQQAAIDEQVQRLRNINPTMPAGVLLEKARLAAIEANPDLFEME